jgi:putative membrane protein
LVYLWLKALHIIAVISWMAGMLYLPRLFVYHAGVKRGSPESDLFEVMEFRLLRYIMTPAMIVVWISGLSLAHWAGFFDAFWLYVKLLLVVGMSAVHGFLSSVRRDFANGVNFRDARFFRIINEVPTILMIVIVVLVVVKPWG